MNKSRAIAFVVASIVSAASFAGAESATPRAAGSGRVARAAQGRGREAGLVKGLTLSATEKANLKEIRVSYRTVRCKRSAGWRAALGGREEGAGQWQGTGWQARTWHGE